MNYESLVELNCHLLVSFPDKQKDATFYERLTLIEKQFPGAAVILHKKGIMPKVSKINNLLINANFYLAGIAITLCLTVHVDALDVTTKEMKDINIISDSFIKVPAMTFKKIVS